MCASRSVVFIFLLLVLSSASTINCCDLEEFFTEKQVSVEESAETSSVIFRGLSRATTPPSPNDVRGVFTTYFELVNTYKGAEELEVWDFSNYRRINVTFMNHPLTECQFNADVPREYIVFCELVENELRALSVAKWDESTDQRVWTALGWSGWSEWSSCSVSCSAGIQQRTRHCRQPDCPGFNIEQRHCNLFGCDITVNPLALEESRFFHPSKERWQRVPDRPSAWRLKPNSYIWVPSTQLFASDKSGPFPRQFVLFITMRVQNSSMGTVFSLRSRRREDCYLSLELAGTDLKLIHVAANGTDVVRIPATLDDGKWHQISVSVRDDSVVESYIDCEWTRTDILKKNSLDIPEDSDLIIGYLFSGDLDQLSIVSDPTMVNLQCSTLRIPIIDPSVKDESEKEQSRINHLDHVAGKEQN